MTSNGQFPIDRNQPPDHRPLGSALGRRLLAGFGALMVALATVGLFLPVLPTVPFLLLAAWAFSRSSPRFNDWLHAHPHFGPPLRRWRRHGVIPRSAKLLATVGLWGNILLVGLFVAESWLLPTLLALAALPVNAYILSRPSRVPG